MQLTLSQIVQHSTELWLALGLVGSALEAVGEYKKWPKLIAFAQRLEAASIDLPKLLRGSRATAAANAEKLKSAVAKDEETQP